MSISPAGPQTVAPPTAGNLMDRISDVSDLEAEEVTNVSSSGSDVVDKIEAADPVDEAPPAEPKPTPEGDEEPEELPEAAKADEEEPATEAEEEPPLISEEGLEIPPSTTFTKKVDGKDVQISLKELLDDFSGKTAVKSRFAEANQIKQRAEARERKLEAKEKAMSADLGKVTSTVTRFLEAAKAGHQRDALDALCELTGADPETTWSAHQQASKAQLEKYFLMTDEERAVFELKQEQDYWKRRATSKNTNDPKTIDQVKTVETRLNEVAKQHGLTRHEISQAHQMLLDLVDKGEYTKEDITVDVVANEALNIKIWGEIDSFCKANLPEKHGDSPFYVEILKDTRQYGITKDQWAQLFNDIKSSTQKGPQKRVVTSKLADKVAKTKPFSSRPKATKSKTDEDEDVWSFDQI